MCFFYDNPEDFNSLALSISNVRLVYYYLFWAQKWNVRKHSFETDAWWRNVVHLTRTSRMKAVSPYFRLYSGSLPSLNHDEIIKWRCLCLKLVFDWGHLMEKKRFVNKTYHLNELYNIYKVICSCRFCPRGIRSTDKYKYAPWQCMPAGERYSPVIAT